MVRCLGKKILCVSNAPLVHTMVEKEVECGWDVAVSGKRVHVLVMPECICSCVCVCVRLDYAGNPSVMMVVCVLCTV